jgi:hypothetical protein
MALDEARRGESGCLESRKQKESRTERTRRAEQRLESVIH